ncbi:energy transducer TonB [Runella aurantiaca]|uniref:Energy transducer TonB n=1 Tax=Runella aurantiaca TaxID=2282308 RepID=A0A369I636_9BACT|nr:energy transducer TonB [Runella aurantiaca]RDB03715.1 energy transducer TonB [Runella aurantiaca]
MSNYKHPFPALAESSEAMTLDDIVFMNRHRAYGAYDLRKSYPEVLRNAVLLGIGLFLLLFIGPILYGSLAPQETEYSMSEFEVMDIKPVPKEEKPLPELEKPKELPKQTSVRYRMLEVLKDPPHEELPPPVEDLEKANPGQETIEGTGPEEVAIIAPPEDTPAPEATKPAEVEAKAPEIFEKVEIDPQFAGGNEGLRTFLMKNLHYPSPAQRSNIQGRVYLTFTVEPDGSLSNINVIRGIGFGCDEEAIRVMKLMPKWKPGKQSGRAVRVKFTMPIVFALE